MTKNEVKVHTMKKCPICGTKFKQSHGRKYCSPECSKEFKRKTAREYNKKYYRAYSEKLHNSKEPISETLGKIIIDWKRRGMSIKSIVKHSGRSENEIRAYLGKIKDNPRLNPFRNRVNVTPSAAGLEFLR